MDRRGVEGERHREGEEGRWVSGRGREGIQRQPCGNR